MQDTVTPFRYGQHVTPDVLAGIAEIAALFGVTKNTALKYTRRPDFPKELDRLAAGPVWKLSDVEQWARDHRPDEGFPRGRPPRA
jgi:hypothetical protein